MSKRNILTSRRAIKASMEVFEMMEQDVKERARIAALPTQREIQDRERAATMRKIHEARQLARINHAKRQAEMYRARAKINAKRWAKIVERRERHQKIGQLLLPLLRRISEIIVVAAV